MLVNVGVFSVFLHWFTPQDIGVVVCLYYHAATPVVCPHTLCTLILRLWNIFWHVAEYSIFGNFRVPPQKNIHNTLSVCQKIKPLHRRHLYVLL
jgi:hypothetical protein